MRWQLLQSATAFFITKCDNLLLQSATAILLQSVTSVITKCDRYYKVWRFCYKVRQVLQSVTIITKCDRTPSRVSVGCPDETFFLVFEVSHVNFHNNFNQFLLIPSISRIDIRRRRQMTWFIKCGMFIPVLTNIICCPVVERSEIITNVNWGLF